MTKKKVKCEFCKKSKETLLYHKGHFICKECVSELAEGKVTVQTSEKEA